MSSPVGQTKRSQRLVIAALIVAVTTAVISALLDRWLRPSSESAPRTARVIERRQPRAEARHHSTDDERPAPSADAPDHDADRPSLSVSGEVVDAAGGAIIARVAIFDAKGEELSRGQTSASGAFGLADTRASASGLIARAEGFETRSMVLERPTPGTSIPPVEVVLDRGSAVTGRVRLADGSPPSTPVRVAVSWDATRSPVTWSATDRARAASRGDLRTDTTTTGPDGTFRIDGLRTGAWYSLAAAGSGLAMVPLEWGRTFVEAEAGGAPVEIVVAPLYVLSVSIRGPNGEPLRTSQFLRSYLFVNLTKPSSLGQIPPYTQTSMEMEWTGLCRPNESDMFSVFHVYASPDGLDRLGPFHMKLRIPGYVPVQLDAWALRAGAGEDVFQEVRLDPLPAGFGRVRIRITDESFAAALRESEGTAVWPAIPQLELRSTDTDERIVRGPMTIPLYPAATGPFEIDGIPCGGYRVRPDLPLGPPKGTITPSNICVGPTDAADIDVAIPAWSGFEVRPVATDSKFRFQAGLSITLRNVKSGASKTWGFQRAPYVVLGVAPGPYEVIPELYHIASEPFRVELSPRQVARFDPRIEVRTDWTTDTR